MRGVLRRLFQRRRDHLLHLVQQDRWRATRPRLIHQTLQTFVHEPSPPLVHRVRCDTQIGRDPLIRHPRLRARQHDPRPQRQRLRRGRPPRPPHKLLPFLTGEHQISFAASRPSPINQPIQPRLTKPLTPLTHGHRGHTQISSDPLVHHTGFRAPQHNPRPKRQPRRPPRPLKEPLTLVIAQHELNTRTRHQLIISK